MVIDLSAWKTPEAVSEGWKKEMPRILAAGRGTGVELDLSKVEQTFASLSAFILRLHCLALEKGFTLSVIDPHGILPPILKEFPPERFTFDRSGDRLTSPSTAEQVGEVTVRLFSSLREQVAIFGEVIVSFSRALLKPRLFRFREIMLCFERAGVDALPITMLIGFLLGLILAFMSAASLRQFGVEVYVADLIAIGLFRELGPIITAIILAGRSGSAFAAEIGTMKVNEEIDALTTFGVSPVGYLALPRVLAATLVMPLLTIFSINCGLVGGGFVLLTMNVPLVTYTQHVIASTTLENLLFGLVKSGFFGLLIGLIGCSCGLQTGRTADAVGRSATEAVVGGLVAITVCDGIFAVLSFLIGI